MIKFPRRYKATISIGSCVIVIVASVIYFTYSYENSGAINSRISTKSNKVGKITPLMQAIDANDEAILKHMLSQGEPLEAEGQLGLTALNYAVNKRKYGMAQVLLDAGANPDHDPGNGVTPLVSTMMTETAEPEKAQSVFASLLQHGADPWASDGTAMLYAASHGRASDLHDLFVQLPDTQRAEAVSFLERNKSDEYSERIRALLDLFK